MNITEGNFLIFSAAKEVVVLVQKIQKAEINPTTGKVYEVGDIKTQEYAVTEVL